MGHVFISYHHDDGDFAEILIDRIKKAGFETWVDNDHLHAGEDWRTEIDQAIKDAFALIVIMTPEARSSEYVTYEWAFAWGAGVKVIPLLYKDTKLHPRLDALQYLSFTIRNARPWDDLIEALKKAANLQVSAPTPSLVSNNIPTYISENIETLRKEIYFSDPLVNSIIYLATIDHPVANQAVTEAAIWHPSKQGRLFAALALGNFENLIEALEDIPDYYFEQLISIKRMDDSVSPILIKALNNKSRKVRAMASEVLGMIRDATAVPNLIECLHDNDKNVQEMAAIALGNIAESTTVPNLIEVLVAILDYWELQYEINSKYYSYDVKIVLGKILINLEDNSIIELKQILQNRIINPTIKRIIVNQLQEIGTQNALDTLDAIKQ